MAGVNQVKHLIFIGFGLFILQACATNEELFAEYDNKFCIVPEYPSQRFQWQPVVYFKSDESQLLEQDLSKLKTNVETLNKLAGYKISLKGFTDHQASSVYNEKLSQKRVQSVTDYLVNELGLDAARVVSSYHGEASPQTGITSGPVERDRRVEMLLLDSSLAPVASQPLLTRLGSQ